MSTLVKVALEAPPKMTFWLLSERVTCPPPCNVTLLTRTSRSVSSPVELRAIVPVLSIVPPSGNIAPSLIVIAPELLVVGS